MSQSLWCLTSYPPDYRAATTASEASISAEDAERGGSGGGSCRCSSGNRGNHNISVCDGSCRNFRLSIIGSSDGNGNRTHRPVFQYPYRGLTVGCYNGS